MGWREQLRKASYKGVDFLVNSSSVTFGRRGQLHEYPFKDIPYSEDLGKKAKEITFDYYLQGDDYISQRNSLIRVIEESTTGTLVHPSLGEILVKPTDACTFNFDGRKGGIETGTLSFVEAGENKFPNVNETTAANVLTKYNKLKTTIRNVFNRVYTTKGLSGFVKDSVDNLCGDYIKQYKLLKRIGEKVALNADKFADDLSNFELNLSTFIPEGGGLDDEIININDSFSASFSSNSDKYEVFKKFNDFEPTILEPTFNTPNRQQEKINLELVRSIFKIVSVSEMALASVNEEFVSSDDVFTRKIDVKNSLNTEIEKAGIDGNEQLRRDLIDLRSVTISTLNQSGASLPNEETIATGDSIPAYTLANNLYGDGNRYQEIIDQNKVLNPLCLPPNKDLKVLSF